MNIPKELDHLPRDRRGFPIPFVVLIDDEGTPHFKVNNDVKVKQCFDEKLCHVCGLPLQNDMWLIGGQLSAFHPKGAFNDSPVHKVCGLFALRTCPYMAYSQYQASGKISDKIKGIFINPTQTDRRLSFFCFVRTKGFKVNWKFGGTFHAVIPVKPYLEIEYWLDGNRITQEEVNTILKEKKEHNHTPKKQSNAATC